MLKDVGIVTLISCLIAVIAAVTGAAVVIWGDPGALSYEDYLKAMAGFVVGLGILGVGRGIQFGSDNETRSSSSRRVGRPHV